MSLKWGRIREETNKGEWEGTISACPELCRRGASSQPTQPKEETPPAKELSDYEKFVNMSPAEQQEFMESFESIEAFFEWYNRVKAEYEAANPPIEVGDGNINLGDYE